MCGGGGVGGHWLCFVVVLFVVAQHWFHAIRSQSPSRTLGQDTQDLGLRFRTGDELMLNVLRGHLTY